ncbi:gametocyte-specific factor 1 homolog [Drosophila obscura]|uniref:gametocyte-specific factor 1 homolog n=1 Tax=Drosophila obscura TaxID=7282 RepID=UPI000B9FDAD3|nr:gametocyte-specific factor 1 homolog [Drosophila obscura]
MHRLEERDMVSCPYNKEHVMLRKKYQQHIIKCRELYKDTVELLVCPFNKGHLVPEPEFHQHTKSCDDRKIIVQYQTSEPAVLRADTRHEKIEADENWDDIKVEDYNPQVYCAQANIVREPNGMFPAQRKAFIKEERRRRGDYCDEEESGQSTSRSENRPTPYNANQQRSKRSYN